MLNKSNFKAYITEKLQEKLKLKESDFSNISISERLKPKKKYLADLPALLSQINRTDQIYNQGTEISVDIPLKNEDRIAVMYGIRQRHIWKKDSVFFPELIGGSEAYITLKIDSLETKSKEGDTYLTKEEITYSTTDFEKFNQSGEPYELPDVVGSSLKRAINDIIDFLYVQKHAESDGIPQIVLADIKKSKDS